MELNWRITHLFQYLEKQIREGELKKVEIVIVDDGSKDNTLSLIKEYTKIHTTKKSVVVRGIQ